MSNARTLSKLTILNVLNAGLGLLNTIIVASYFGTGRAVEIYFAAIGLYASVLSLTQTGQVSEVLLPSYHRIRETHGREDAFQAYTALTNRFVFTLLILGLFGWLVAPMLMALRVPGFGPAEISLAALMFRWILPLLVLQIAVQLLKTLANAERLFGTPEMVSAAARMLSLAALVLLSGKLGTWALVASLWCAALMEILGILWLLKRSGYRYRFTFRMPEGTGNVRVFRKLVATLPYVSMTQVYLFVLDAALSHLSQGSFAVFRYATTIWARTQGIFLRPVSLTFFTSFSETTARGSGAGGALTERALAQVLSISAIVTTAVLTGAEQVLTGLWSGARFPAEQVTSLVWVLGGLYIFLPVTGFATVLRKVAVSLQCIGETYIAMAFVQVVSALLAWQLVPAFGLAGGLAVSVLNMVGFCAAPLIAMKVAGNWPAIRYPLGRIWRWLLAVTGGLLAGLVTKWLVGDAAFEPGGGRLVVIGLGCILATVSVAATFGLSLALRVPESRQLTVACMRMCRR